MSDLQKTVKPTLGPLAAGNWPTLSLQAQADLAAWATMFAMVLEMAEPSSALTPQSCREDFRRTRKPPGGWHIWLGRYDLRGEATDFAAGKWFTFKSNSAQGLTQAAHLRETTMSVGHVFFHIRASTPDENLARIDTDQLASRFCMRAINPANRQLSMRPTRALTKRQLGELATNTSFSLGIRQTHWFTPQRRDAK